MPLQARFEADFQSFYSAVQKAEVSLESFEGKANKVGTTINKMAESFSGRRIIQEATLMSAAIEKSGGVSKLTDAEMRRLTATIGAAADKMKALGSGGDGVKAFQAAITSANTHTSDSFKKLFTNVNQTTTATSQASDQFRSLFTKAPAQVQALTKEVQPLPSVFGKISGAVTAVGGALGIVFTGAAIINGIKNQIAAGLDYSSMLVNLRAKTELSYRDLQILDDVGISTGVSVQSLATAVQILQQRLGDGTARKGIQALGLSFDEILRMSPAEQLTAIGTAIAKIEDPTKRAAAGNAVFSRSFREIVPAIRTDMDEIAKKVKFMSDAQIEAGDSISARWNKFWHDQDKGWGAWASNIILNWEKVRAKQAEFNNRGALPNLPTAPVPRIGGGATVNDVFDPTMISRLKIAGKTLEDLAKSSDLATTAANKHAAAVENLVNKLGGQEAISNAKAWMSALRQIGGLTQLSETDQKDLSKALDAALAAYRRLGIEAPRAMQDVADASRPALTATNLLVGALGRGPASLGNAVADTSEYIESYGGLLFTATQRTDAFGKTTYTQAVPALGQIRIGFDEAQKSTSTWDDSLGKLSKVFAQLSQTSGSSMGKIAQSIGTVITSMELATQAGKEFKASLADVQGEGDGSKADGYSGLAISALAAASAIDAATNATSKTASVLGGAAAGAQAGAKAFGAYGAAAGAVVGALVGLAKSNAAEGKNVSPLRDEFFKMAGGLEKLNPLVERLTGNFSLVQRVFDAKTVQEYNLALAELNRLFEFQATSMQTLDDTVKKYNLTVEEMGPAFQRQELDKKAIELFQDYQVLTKAGADHVLVVGKMADAINTYVADAVKMGVEVPSAMEPMLQQMVDAGLLLDANGNKFGSLEEAGISFAMTMSEGFTTLIDEVKKLTDAIVRGLGLALENIPDAEVEIRGRFIPPKDMGDFDFPAIEMARGGTGMVKKPTLFLAGEAGPEEFAFSGSHKRFTGASESRGFDVSGLKEELVSLRRDMARRDRLAPRILTMAMKDALTH